MKADGKIYLLVLFLGVWYYLVFQLFIQKNNIEEDSPHLRARLGTILWHSSDKGGVSHNYCYYPWGNTIYPNKRGEYIIKREDSGNCQGFYGQAIFYEGSWVSEREKIWWSKDQKLEELATKEDNQNTL